MHNGGAQTSRSEKPHVKLQDVKKNSYSTATSTLESSDAIDGKTCAALNSRNELLLKNGKISLDEYSTNKKAIVKSFMDGKKPPILIGDPHLNSH